MRHVHLPSNARRQAAERQSLSIAPYGELKALSKVEGRRRGAALQRRCPPHGEASGVRWLATALAWAGLATPTCWPFDGNLLALAEKANATKTAPPKAVLLPADDPIQAVTADFQMTLGCLRLAGGQAGFIMTVGEPAGRLRGRVNIPFGFGYSSRSAGPAGVGTSVRGSVRGSFR